MQTLLGRFSRIQSWWRTALAVEQWAAVCLIIAMGIGFAFRFTNLASSLQFQADQGRDALVAYNILRGDIALIGPSTSVGDMFLGPLYYYFMAPFLLLFGLSPAGPAYAVAFLALLTIPLLFWIAKQWFGAGVAGLSVLLYTAAPWVVEYSRFSWNPNPAPLVSLLMWWGGWKALQGNQRWWAWVSFWFAVLIQLHYVALLAIVPVGLMWLWKAIQTGRAGQWTTLKKQLLWTLVAAGILIASLTPLVIFDIRFDGIISHGFFGFMESSNEGTGSGLTRILEAIEEQEGRTLYVFGEFWGGKDSFDNYRNIMKLVIGLGLFAWVSFGWRVRQNSERAQLWVYVSLMALTTIMGLAWYRGVVYAHYITYFYPIIVIMTAAALVEMAQWRIHGRIIAAGLLTAAITGSMLADSHGHRVLHPASWQFKDMDIVAQRVLEEVPEGSTYAMTLLSEIRDYRGMNYRYFLETSQRPPVDLAISHQADYLVVIAESPDDPTNVLGSPVYEIVTYPRGEYRVVELERGPKLYIIKSSQTGPETTVDPAS